LRDPELLKESKSFFHKAGLLSSSPEFRDFIMRLICFEERHRWTFDQLLNHPWLIDIPKNLVPSNYSGNALPKKTNPRKNTTKPKKTRIPIIKQSKNIRKATSIKVHNVIKKAKFCDKSEKAGSTMEQTLD